MRLRTAAAAIGLSCALIALSPIALSPAAAGAATSVVNISANCTAFCFVPRQLTVAVGDTVTWKDKTGTGHTVTRCRPSDCNGVSGGTGTDARFTSTQLTIAPGGTARFTFTEPGTYVYYCTIHSYSIMHGTITVTAAAPTTTAVATPPTAAPGPSVVPAPQLPHTGGRTNGVVAWALSLIVIGLAASTLRLRHRRS